ncbi:MAG: YihY/virulence factor BrkB family protein, partial [Spirochaetota bacterium]
QIYHTSMDRNQLGRFTQFVTFLVVGTILVSVYFSMNALMSDFIREYVFVNQFVQVIGNIGPWIVMWLFLFILIFAVPNTKVKMRSALIGSVVGTVSFQLVSQIFSRVVLKVVDYSIIYGSFAAILITLIWIYLWWIIIFGAVEVAYVHQYRPGKREKRGLPNPPAEQIARGFEILRGMAAHFKDGKGAVNVLDLGNQLKITDRTLNTYLDVLERAGYILRIDRTGHHYVPSRPLNDLPADQIARTLYGEFVKGMTKESPGERIAMQILHKGVGSLRTKNLDDIS